MRTPIGKFFAFSLIIAVMTSVAQAVQIEPFITAIDSATAKKSTTAQQIAFVQSLNTLLNTPTFTKSQYASTFSELSTYTSNKVKILQGIQSLSKDISSTSPHSKPSEAISYLSLKGVDSEKVRTTLLDWHNQERQSLQLPKYSYHSELERSATSWAESLREEERTTNTHTRPPNEQYYDVQNIKNWFGELGIAFANDTFSESVGRGYYKCDKADCTDDLLNAVRSSWEFFMSEKEKGGSHYKAIISKQFTQMGVGIAIDSARKRYYLVIHYGADVLW